ncbi:MAG: tetratricopeptide repeat protein [Candidatus Edwardsbacteria bacterium]|jgi:tetratricopeptide (TPR) repeat protein|nr:tetratricopeptide repeat protein [Candidatus Edwardsbacteria bacterium]
MADSKILPPEIDKLTQQLVLDPKSKVFAQLADAYRKAGMLDEAIETCKRGVEQNPEFATGRLVLGKCYLAKKMSALAIEELQAAARIDPQNLAAYRQLAQAYEEQGQKDEAIRYYQRILDLEPGESEIEQKIEQLKGTA